MALNEGMDLMNVLILSVSTGHHHYLIAEAIKESIEKNEQNTTVEIVDVLKYIPPVIDKIVSGGYLAALRTVPYLYSKVSGMTNDNDGASTKVDKEIKDYLLQQLQYLINNFSPDIIVCTHPFHSRLLASLESRNSAAIVSIVTDFFAHNYPTQNCVDSYIIHNEDLVKEFVDIGIAEKKIFPLGIPIKEKFLEGSDSQKLFSKHNMENKFTVMIIEGGLRSVTVKNVLSELLDSSLDIQIIIFSCNKTLLKQIENIAVQSNKKVISFSEADELSDYMAISDLLIIKPDGLTVSEAMVKELPMLIISPLPGKEKKNTDYLTGCGTVIEVKENKDIVKTIDNLMRDKERLSLIKISQAKMAKPLAAAEVCKLLTTMGKRTLF